MSCIVLEQCRVTFLILHVAHQSYNFSLNKQTKGEGEVQ